MSEGSSFLGLNYIPLYGYPMFCLFISSVDKQLVVFHFLAMVSTDFMNLGVQVLYRNVFISLEYVPRFRLAEFFFFFFPEGLQFFFFK